MSEKNSMGQGIAAANNKLEEIEERLDLIHESMKELNGAVDMLVRFSMTTKAFMELSISQGLIDPHELNRIASHYVKSYSANLETADESKEYSFTGKRFTT